jgi:aminoglycoside phosphotransferase family enzyme
MLPGSHEWLVENSSGCNECCNNWKIVRSTAVITLKRMTLNIMVAILSSAGHTLTHSNRKKVTVYYAEFHRGASRTNEFEESNKYGSTREIYSTKT